MRLISFAKWEWRSNKNLEVYSIQALVNRAPLLPPALFGVLGILFVDQKAWVFCATATVLLCVFAFLRQYLQVVGCLIAFTMFALLHQARLMQQTDLRAKVGERIEIQGRVDDFQKTGFREVAVRLELFTNRFVNSPVCLLLEGLEGHDLGKGDEILCSGRLIPWAENRNPGLLDQSEFFWRNGIAGQMQVDEFCVKKRSKSKVDLNESFARWREDIAEKITAGLDSKGAPAKVILGVSLGMKRSADPVTQKFKNSGALHIFAVSGMHVGMLALIVFFVLKNLGVRRTYCAWVVIPVLFLYACVTGFSPATARAAVMMSVLLIAYSMRRQAWALNAIALSAVLFLFFDTHQLFQVGFQMSYTILCGLLLVSPWMNRFLLNKVNHDAYLPVSLVTKKQRFAIAVSRWIVGLVFVSAIASCLSAPFTLAHFKLIAPIGILASVLIVPQSFVLLALSILSLLLSPISDSLNIAVNRLNSNVAAWMLRSVELCEKVPAAYWNTSSEVLKNDIVVYDLAEGNGVLINMKSPLLIDAGRYQDAFEVLLPSLQNLNIRPEKLLITHPGGDAVGGVLPMMNSMPVEEVHFDFQKVYGYSSRRVLESIEQGNMQRISGLEISLNEGLSLRCISPVSVHQRGRADDRGSVWQLNYHGKKILFVSDIGFETERFLLERRCDLDSDILVMGRHSSDFCGTDAFIRAVSPKAIIASHSPKETIPEQWQSRILSQGIQLYHQGECGAVIIRPSEENLEILPYLKK